MDSQRSARDRMKKTVLISGAVVALVVAAPAGARLTLDGWWRFDDTTGGIAKDSSGNRNNGTVTPAAQPVDGYFGSALSFDGNTASVDVPDNPSLEPASTITVTAWFKGGPQNPFGYLVSKGGQGCRRPRTVCTRARTAASCSTCRRTRRSHTRARRTPAPASGTTTGTLPSAPTTAGRSGCT